MVYVYEDVFIVGSLELSEIEDAETKAIHDVTKQGVEDEFYIEQMVKCLVYIDLATRQVEAEGMKDKISSYNKTYDRYSRMNTTTGGDEMVGTVTLGRA